MNHLSNPSRQTKRAALLSFLMGSTLIASPLHAGDVHKNPYTPGSKATQGNTTFSDTATAESQQLLPGSVPIDSVMAKAGPQDESEPSVEIEESASATALPLIKEGPVRSNPIATVPAPAEEHSLITPVEPGMTGGPTLMSPTNLPPATRAQSPSNITPSEFAVQPQTPSKSPHNALMDSQGCDGVPLSVFQQRANRPMRLPTIAEPGNPPTMSEIVQRRQYLAPASRAPERLPRPTLAHPESSVANAKTPTPIVSSPATAVQSAADSLSPLRLASSPKTTARQVNWLPSDSSTSRHKESLRLIEQAQREFRIRAYASAESSAWEALHHIATGIDLAANQVATSTAQHSKVANLNKAKTAVWEARDFAGKYGDLDFDGVRRVVRSHQTDVLKSLGSQDISANEAIDRYLNQARVHFSSIAECRVEAARTLDLLAAIYLRRNDEKTLPSATSLTLRRSALQGQPGNAGLALQLGKHLADLGLDEEATWALSHSLSMRPNRETAELLAQVTDRAGDRQAAVALMSEIEDRFPNPTNPTESRVPEVVQLSPKQFASVSRPVMNEPAVKPASAIGQTESVSTAAFKKATSSIPAKPSDKPSKPGLMKSLGKFWRNK